MNAHQVFDYDLTAEELSAWVVRTDFERAAFDDPVWRLANIYECQDEDGRVLPFVPTPEQRLVIWCLYVRGWQKLIIPKARQLGMSLLLCLVLLDGLAFTDGFKAAWVDKRAGDAKKKLKNKVLFAFDRMPESLREGLRVGMRTVDKFAVSSFAEDAADSESEFGISFRGDTVELLVLSEWGWIQANDRLRSIEINTGALPAAERSRNGRIVVETTWEGGLDGELGPYVTEALTVPEEQKGSKSWRVIFFGWQTNSLYAQEHGWIHAVAEKYFAMCATKGVHLTHQQKLWYAEKMRGLGPKVKKEYPTFVWECWEAVAEGSIYGVAIEQARSEGRVCDFLTDQRYPVHTFWDLGHPINTVCWFVQITPTAIRVLDVLMELDIPMLEDRWARMQAKGYIFGTHFLPWDGEAANSVGIKTVDHFRRVMGPNVKVVTQVEKVWTAISEVQAMFTRFVFHGTNCRVGLEHLVRYRAERETTNGGAIDRPVHDKYSHAADAFRQIAQAINAGMIPNAGAVGAAVRPASQGAGNGVVRAWGGGR
jgi:hypothetical protein